MVSLARRMSRAISLGVFWRLAPSTMAIMRSRKLSPGFEPMRTMIQSLRTWVPPVTLERSPPASRMTGADSPVTADSLTEAMPSTTSPSPGMREPASTRTRSPLRSVEPETRVVLRLAGLRPWVHGRSSFLAWTSRLLLRRDSAWALPRPSAMASAKLAKRTVNQSQRAMTRTRVGV